MLLSCHESVCNFTGSKLVHAGGLVVSRSDYRPGDVQFNSPQGNQDFYPSCSPLSIFLLCRVNTVAAIQFEPAGGKHSVWVAPHIV